MEEEAFKNTFVLLSLYLVTGFSHFFACSCDIFLS